jgi:hypothetical protein
MTMVRAFHFRLLALRDEYGIRAPRTVAFHDVGSPVRAAARSLRALLQRPLTIDEVFWIVMVVLVLVFLIALTSGGAQVWN